MEIQIRKAEPADAKDWARIRKECWLNVYPNKKYDITREDILLKDFDSPEKIQMWRDSFVTPRDNATYYSAVIDSKVAGMCIAYDEGLICEIGALYVDLDFHGRGVGTKLIKYAMANFDQLKKVNLKVVSYNEKAINFYKKIGFRIIGPFNDSNGKLPNGKKLPEIEMIKD